MSAIDFSKIKVGDKVKVRVDGLVSEDWQEVTRVSGDPAGVWLVLDRLLTVYDTRATIIAHQPPPRKVEVTLGEPLPLNRIKAFQGLPRGRQLTVKHAILCLHLAIHDGEGRATGIELHNDDVRSLALLLLATVGTE